MDHLPKHPYRQPLPGRSAALSVSKGAIVTAWRALLSARLHTHEASKDAARSGTRVDGEPASKWSKSVVHLTASLARAQSIMSLTDLLANESVDINLSCHLVERFGDVDLKVTPSHGDFIYWNVLVGGEQRSLVDFEYVSECRVIGFDDLHYRFAPWMHRWIRWRLPEQLLIWWGLRQARFVCRQNHLSMQPELLLAMFFIHWAAIRRQPHLQFDLYPIERSENWATLV